MLNLTGELRHAFISDKGEKDGKEFGGQHKIQILGEIPLRNGGYKEEMVTLTCHDYQLFEHLKGEKIHVPVGVLASGKNIIYFIPKNSKPEIIQKS